MELISRDKAKSTGLTRYYTGKPCRKGHFSERMVCNQACLQCNRINHAKYEKSAKYKVVRNKNAKTPNRLKSDRFDKSKMRADKLRRTPSWADLVAIKEIYMNCPTGYHVDHIIPLKGKLVSGLHVLENLQYLTASENCSKSNKFNIED